MGVELALACVGVTRAGAGAGRKILIFVLAAGAACVLALVGSASSCSRQNRASFY